MQIESIMNHGYRYIQYGATYTFAQYCRHDFTQQQTIKCSHLSYLVFHCACNIFIASICNSIQWKMWNDMSVCEYFGPTLLYIWALNGSKMPAIRFYDVNVRHFSVGPEWTLYVMNGCVFTCDKMHDAIHEMPKLRSVAHFVQQWGKIHAHCNQVYIDFVASYRYGSGGENSRKKIFSNANGNHIKHSKKGYYQTHSNQIW